MTEFVMPSAVGGDLQAAQDAVQAVAADPMFISYSHDLSGQERGQMVDSNWKVCTQEPAPGATFTKGTRVDFGVVKLDETCLDETSATSVAPQPLAEVPAPVPEAPAPTTTEPAPMPLPTTTPAPPPTPASTPPTTSVANVSYANCSD